MNIFPMIQPGEGTAVSGSELPLYKETAWDFQNNKPIFSRGEPLILSGQDAVKVWAFKALHTIRHRHEIYSHDYGSDFESLIGQNYSKNLKEAEAARYLRECLLINPYITDVTGVEVYLENESLTVKATVSTIYGEVNIHALV